MREYRFDLLPKIFALSGYCGAEKMSRLCSIEEYGLDRVLAVSGNIVKKSDLKFYTPIENINSPRKERRE